MQIVLVGIIVVLVCIILFLIRKQIKPLIGLYLSKKKITIPVTIVLVVGIAIGVVFGLNNSDSSYSKKMVKHLENVGFTCDYNAKNEDGFPMEGYAVCRMGISNGVYKEMQISRKTKNANGITYYEYDSGTYKIRLQGSRYVSTRGNVIYEDKIENKNFRFSGDTKFSIGHIVNCDNEMKKYQEACLDDAKDMNRALREFEGYFSGAGLKMEGKK